MPQKRQVHLRNLLQSTLFPRTPFSTQINIPIGTAPQRMIEIDFIERKEGFCGGLGGHELGRDGTTEVHVMRREMGGELALTGERRRK